MTIHQPQSGVIGDVLGIEAITGNPTPLGPNDSCVGIDASAGPAAALLPLASTCPGKAYEFWRVDASGNVAAIETSGADTIVLQAGAYASLNLALQNQAIKVRSRGGAPGLWQIISSTLG